MVGDYRFCLDNRFSRFSKKLVYFELETTSEDDDDDDDWQLNKDELEELVDMKIEDFKVSFDTFYFGIIKIQEGTLPQKYI